MASEPTSAGRELAAIMFSDIAGFTLLMGRDEEKGLEAVAEHRAHLRSVLPKFNGRIIGEAGDGTLSSFHSAVDALACARELQISLEQDPLFRLRIGIHVGDVLFRDNTVLGDGVNVASRIHALAPPGGICFSERVYEEIRNKPEFRVKDLGAQKLKNVIHPVHVYALVEGAEAGCRTIGELAFRPRLFVLLGAALIAAAAYYVLSHRPLTFFQPTAAAPTIHSIAVLPLQNFTGDPAQEYFSDGITDEITTDLAEMAPLRVTSRTSVMQFKGTTKPLPEIARALHVDAIVEGSVARSGDKVRISAQLIDAQSDKHLWANNFVKRSRDVLELQDELAREIADAIRLKLTSQEQTRMTRTRPIDPAAYDDYLKGRFFWNARTEESLAKSKQYFEQSIAIDPVFAPAYSGLADSYIYRGYLWGRLPPREAMPLARAAAEKAIQLDGELAEGHTSLAIVMMLYDWDFAAAEEEFKRAVALNANYASAHHFYAIDLAALGKSEESVSEARRALQADPLSIPVNNILGEMLIDAHHYDEAIEVYGKALEMEPNNPLLHLNLVRAYMGKGMDKQAFEESVKIAAESGASPQQIVEYRKAFAKLGWPVVAEVSRQLALADWNKTHWHADAFSVATSYASVGDYEHAFAWFDKAFELRSGMLIWPFFIEHDPWEEKLRAEPRFAEFRQRMTSVRATANGAD